jgi:predicted aconitase
MRKVDGRQSPDPGSSNSPIDLADRPDTVKGPEAMHASRFQQPSRRHRCPRRRPEENAASPATTVVVDLGRRNAGVEDTVRLTDEERAMLAGAQGEAVRRALDYQAEVGRFFGAERFVPITNAHMMGDIEVLGDAGPRLPAGSAGPGRAGAHPGHHQRPLRGLRLGRPPRPGPGRVRQGARGDRRAASDGRRHGRHLHQLPDALPAAPGRARRLGRHGHGDLRQLRLRRAEQLRERAGGDGGRDHGRTPEYGFQLDRHRKGRFVVDLSGATLGDLADWGALGKIVGERHQNYYAVPVFTGFRRAPLADELKQLGCALASYGSMGMFHMVGVTPEAPSVEAALGGEAPWEAFAVSDADIEAVYRGYPLGDGDCSLVVFSGPQLSLFEMKDLGRAVRGAAPAPRHAGLRHHLQRRAERRREAGLSQAAGGRGRGGAGGVCFYILQNLSLMRERNGWRNMISNSAKIVNIIGAHRFRTILRRTADCVEIACTGKLS